MKRFKFSYESVLFVRQKTLKDERIKLASVFKIYNKQKEALLNMKKTFEYEVSRLDSYLKDTDINPGFIINSKTYLNKLMLDMENQQEAVNKTEIILEKQKQEVNKAYINVKSLENLLEKQKAIYKSEFYKKENKILDDIVSSGRKTES